ncbi:glycine cleavage system aminomethyltransferase GcvT [Haloglomus litoreum]|uniref:glycine cleavage system aminomethyltransferase GcvT n=1 Tax=Haloglomus litoreum TaxID=3034026 RepID=UPI0023E82E85|nr:glycine cleavage system aminomethyltransferase GcvT [Haloglomus sp. DT116]
MATDATSDGATRRSPLHDRHETAGARFTDFGGWDMPVSFDGIRAEHTAVRTTVGKFDVSHMGEVEVRGPDAGSLVQRLTTNDASALDPGDAQYACITREDGVILDDTVTYRLPDRAAYLFVPNAGNGEMMREWFAGHAAEWGLDVSVTDRTDEYAMFAVQGPDALSLVDDRAAAPVSGLDRFTATTVAVAGVECTVARTGYTGEDGVELLVPWAAAERVWTALECQPCGLGARDTLRLEAGLLLSGQDFHPEDEPRTPVEAGLTFVVDLDTDFVGRDAIAAQQEDGPAERLVGFELTERGVPRHGYDILADWERVGHVTSGTMSSTLDVPLGFGYVPAEYADEGQHIAVDIRDEPVPGEVVNRRFLARRE